ncbi:diguanylate cyclase [Bacillus coahuilensis m2-6]|uniref:diguanylate cyclase domain-containing protein n=1 Tax=Bacillus coahuilensis TaxID=408580 RepID=UPI0007506B09|nr:diguanylate cyclase [Bacillus coahuilensis]KUP07384.1 diguanylate cyclase [Bacillus coahuilensis m2-6]
MTIKLRTFVALLFAVIIILLTVSLSYFIGQQSSEKVTAEIGNSLSTTAYQMADKLDFFMWSREGEIEVLSELEALKDLNNIEEMSNLLEQLQESFPAFSWVGITDKDGKVIAATDNILKGADISMRPVYMEGIKGRFIGDVHDAVLLADLLPNPSGEPMKFVDISRAIENDEGEPIGVLAAHLSWDWSKQVERDLLLPLENYLRGAEVFIISKADDTVLLGPSKMVGSKLELRSIQQAQNGKNDWQLETWPDEKEYVTGYAYGQGYQNYEGLGWTVLVRIPKEIAYQPLEDLQQSILLIGLGFAVLFSFLGWYLSGFFTKPLRRITISANQLMLGQNVEIPEYKGIKDIEILSTTLRDLVSSLVKSVKDLNDMESLAHHDKLTGLYNRIYLDTYIEKESKQAMINGDTLTYLFLDLDGFKLVNDHYGHEAGDVLLKEVANRLTQSISLNDQAFRIGGDEFLLILHTSERNYRDVANKIGDEVIHRLNLPFELPQGAVHIGCSIGAAVWKSEEQDGIDIIRYADEALYESKRTGKNKLTFSSTAN